MTNIRQDRFFSAIPGVDDEKFENSDFLRLYNQTEKRPSTDSVTRALRTLPSTREESHSMHQIIRAIENAPREYNAAKVYTSNLPLGSQRFYGYVNRKLMQDDYAALEKLMPFIRRATSQINEYASDRDCTLYRSMTLNDQQIQYFTIGKCFRFPGFTSTSENERTAREFGNVCFTIHVTAPCHQVINMTRKSYIRTEQEWLFSPYSCFQVIGRNGHEITLRTLENLTPIPRRRFNTNRNYGHQNIHIEISVSDED